MFTTEEAIIQVQFWSNSSLEDGIIDNMEEIIKSLKKI